MIGLQVECNKGPASDKQGFAALVRELSEQFKPKGLLLSSAVSPNKLVIDKGYDVPTLAKYLDWIAVMTYDYHGQWDKKTGHVAPMYYHESDDAYFFNANYSINYWISKGAPPRSIVMGENHNIRLLKGDKCIFSRKIFVLFLKEVFRREIIIYVAITEFEKRHLPHFTTSLLISTLNC